VPLHGLWQQSSVGLTAVLNPTMVGLAERICPVLGFVLLLTVFLGPGCVRKSTPIRPRSSVTQWYEFQGTWTAAGSRDSLSLQGSRTSSISTFSGSLLLAGRSRPGIGFRSEAIIFNDSETGLVGRAVWVDEHGDKVYSELRNDPAESNKIIGTFIGGTGRYTGVTGNYEFSWRFAIQNEDGAVQGQSVGLNGRIFVASPVSAMRDGNP